MTLPPIYDEDGTPKPLDPDEHLELWIEQLATDRAGGWAPDSIPGKQARSEVEAVVREIQARAVEAHELWLSEILTMNAGIPWWPGHETDTTVLAEDAGQAIIDYNGDPWNTFAEHIRAGRTDLSGKKRSTS